MADIIQQRLYNQRLTYTEFTNPVEVVSWLGAVQSQDYTGAKWAVAMRAKGLTDAALDKAFNEGALLRTHVLRPTWHFLTPADIRWILALTAPRVHAVNASMGRKLELDEDLCLRSNTALAKALEGGKQLTRTELAEVLRQEGIDTTDLRLTYLVMHAELDGVICSGAKRGKQFTYALLDERAPNAKNLPRDEALAELTKRYFTSHGPATIKDFTGWSGLTVADAKAGLDMLKSQIVAEVIEGQTYWFAPSAPPAKKDGLTAYLLSNYDEYVGSNTYYGVLIDSQRMKKMSEEDIRLFPHALAIDGYIVGTWRRTFKKNTLVIQLSPMVSLNAAENDAVHAAAQRYGEFWGMGVEWA